MYPVASASCRRWMAAASGAGGRGARPPASRARCCATTFSTTAGPPRRPPPRHHQHVFEPPRGQVAGYLLITAAVQAERAYLALLAGLVKAYRVLPTAGSPACASRDEASARHDRGLGVTNVLDPVQSLKGVGARSSSNSSLYVLPGGDATARCSPQTTRGRRGPALRWIPALCRDPELRPDRFQANVVSHPQRFRTALLHSVLLAVQRSLRDPRHYNRSHSRRRVTTAVERSPAAAGQGRSVMPSPPGWRCRHARKRRRASPRSAATTSSFKRDAARHARGPRSRRRGARAAGPRSSRRRPRFEPLRTPARRPTAAYCYFGAGADDTATATRPAPPRSPWPRSRPRSPAPRRSTA